MYYSLLIGLISLYEVVEARRQAESTALCPGFRPIQGRREDFTFEEIDILRLGDLRLFLLLRFGSFILAGVSLVWLSVLRDADL